MLEYQSIQNLYQQYKIAQNYCFVFNKKNFRSQKKRHKLSSDLFILKRMTIAESSF